MVLPPWSCQTVSVYSRLCVWYIASSGLAAKLLLALRLTEASEAISAEAAFAELTLANPAALGVFRSSALDFLDLAIGRKLAPRPLSSFLTGTVDHVATGPEVPQLDYYHLCLIQLRSSGRAAELMLAPGPFETSKTISADATIRLSEGFGSTAGACLWTFKSSVAVIAELI